MFTFRYAVTPPNTAALTTDGKPIRRSSMNLDSRFELCKHLLKAYHGIITMERKGFNAVIRINAEL